MVRFGKHGIERVDNKRNVALTFVYCCTGSSYPGMVNLSGTLCYMNSILQVRWPLCQTFNSVT